eukprot:5985117-Alexandrium_andersonii.AAC.1
MFQHPEPKVSLNCRMFSARVLRGSSGGRFPEEQADPFVDISRPEPDLEAWRTWELPPSPRPGGDGVGEGELNELAFRPLAGKGQ